MTSGLRAWALLAAIPALLSAGPGGLRAQQRPSRPDETVAAFVAAWTGGNAASLQEYFSPDGVRLGLGGREHAGVRPRQVKAALEEFLGRHEPGEARVRRVEVLGGHPPRALAELGWTTRVRGTREVADYVIFLGFELLADHWRITELRVLP